MRRESQRELIEEGFIDFVKGVASRTADIGRAVGKGIDKVVSSDIGRGVAAAFMKTPVGQGLKRDFEPILEPTRAFNMQQPLGVLKIELKDRYYRTFDFKSIKYGKEQKLPGDETYDNRVAIPFKARWVREARASGSSPGSSSGNQPTVGNIVGGFEDSISGNLDDAEGNLNNFVAILGRDKKSAFGLTSETGVYRLQVIRAEDGKKIEPDTTGSRFDQKITSAEWREITTDVGGDRPSNDAKGLKFVLQNIAYYAGKRLDSNNTLKTAIQQDLQQRRYDLPETYKVLKTQRLAESTKISQLQLLESSYNLRYELPINKGN